MTGGSPDRVPFLVIVLIAGDDPEIPEWSGKINNVEKFDSLFFGIHYKQANMMDPMCGIPMKHAYVAIIDAGVNPRQLRGTNTGVFIGACFSESEKNVFCERQKPSRRIELARLLEFEGLNGRLMLIAMAHLMALSNEHLTPDIDDQLHSSLLSGLMDIVASSFGTQLVTELQNFNTWEERLAAFTKTVPQDKNLNFTPEDLQAIYSSVYYRIKAILNYDSPATSPLSTWVILLKPKIESVQRSMSEDYGLKSKLPWDLDNSRNITNVNASDYHLHLVLHSF